MPSEIGNKELLVADLVVRRSFLAVVAPFALLGFVSCGTDVFDEAWMVGLHEEARSHFFASVYSGIDEHAERAQLTETEIEKIEGARERYDKLPDILLNVYYQKDEPRYRELFEAEDAYIPSISAGLLIRMRTRVDRRNENGAERDGPPEESRQVESRYPHE